MIWWSDHPVYYADKLQGERDDGKIDHICRCRSGKGWHANKVLKNLVTAQHVCRQEKQVPAIKEEIMAKETSYDHPFSFYFEIDDCTARFKTNQGIFTHTRQPVRSTSYVNTSQYFEVEKVRSVYGKTSRKLFLVSKMGRLLGVWELLGVWGVTVYVTASKKTLIPSG